MQDLSSVDLRLLASTTGAALLGLALGLILGRRWGSAELQGRLRAAQRDADLHLKYFRRAEGERRRLVRRLGGDV